MAVYLVTWDLNRAKPNYEQARQTLITHLSRYSHTRDQGLDSVWFIESNNTADTIDADIRTRMDDNDRLFVTKLVTGSHQGWLTKDIWSWIDARV